MIKDLLNQLFPTYENLEFFYWYEISDLKILSKQHIETRLLQISKIKHKKKKMYVLDEFIDTITSELIDNSGYNIIIYNIPETYRNGICVTEQTIYDSFMDYGDIFCLHKFNDIVYIWFIYNNDAMNLCNTINNMQCEENILKCQYTESNLIMNNYDWHNKTTYKTFNFKGVSFKLN